MATFNSEVLVWLQAHVAADATTVTEVLPYGTDWAGDTEGGFHSEFGVTIRYTTGDGGSRSTEVRGEDMESLWKHVVRAYPE